MHHDPGHVTAFLIGAATGVIVATAVLVVIRPQVQRRMFAGPRLDAWQQARRQLGWADQWRVIWATQFNHLTSRAALAHAQLAYARYLQDAAKRSIERQWRPGLWKGLRLTTAAGLGFTALGWWATAATQSQGSARVFPYLAAAWFAFCAPLHGAGSAPVMEAPGEADGAAAGQDRGPLRNLANDRAAC